MKLFQKKKKEKEFGLKLIIEVSEHSSSSNYFNPKKIENKYTILVKENSYLFISKDNKLVLSKYQGEKKEDERTIFLIELEEKNAQLSNLFPYIFYDGVEKFNAFINNLNSRLYKIIKKCPDENIFNNDKLNMNYIHYLKKNDIIRRGQDVKLILKEFHLSNKKEENDNINELINIKIENNEDQVCNICGKKFLDQENPLIKFCLCGKYTHFNCKKEEIKRTEEIYKEDCFKYNIKNCDECKKIIPLSFICNNKPFKLYDFLLKNSNEDFLLFESSDYYNNTGKISRNIFYIKINEDKETILIGGENKAKKNYVIKFDKLIKIYEDSISFEQAIIECDRKEQILKLKNINEKHDIMVLQEDIILKPDDEMIYIQYENTLIGAKLIKRSEFDETENEMKNNPDIIEKRTEIISSE